MKAKSPFSINGDKETIGGTRPQIAKVFGCTDQNVLMHIQKIYKGGELDPASTSKKSLLVQNEGGRSVKRTVELFNLDVILAIGYRVNYGKAAEFRKWATLTLSKFLVDGFVLDKGESLAIRNFSANFQHDCARSDWRKKTFTPK